MTTRRFLILVNPASGTRRGLVALEQVRPVFAAADAELDVRITEQSGHARRLVQTLDLAEYHGICLVGGDGTVHEVVSGLLERGHPASLPLGLVPAGTGNDVAEQLGVGSPLQAAQRIVAGRTSPFDVAKVVANGQTSYCVTIIGWVGVADVNCTAERLRLLGPPRYAVAAIWQVLFAKRRPARLMLDDRTIDDEFLLVVACNTVFSGSGMRLAPHAKVDDGKIDVVFIRRATRWQLLRVFAKVFAGAHVKIPCVEYQQVRSLSILSDDGSPLDLDGEIRGTTPVLIQMIPGAVQMFS
jgi:YegS/Rv2252/BmrU family lipid kinase